MVHIGTKTIETERLLLRRFVADDAQFMFDNWANDPEVTRHLAWPTHESVDNSRLIIESWLPLYESDDYYHWVIVLKEIGQPIGSISSVRQDDNTEMVHIGYCIGRNWWRRGITSEALSALIRFFFDEVGVNRIEARHDTNNPNSGKVMQKCGMLYEGTTRQSERTKHGLSDMAHYAILKST